MPHLYCDIVFTFSKKDVNRNMQDYGKELQVYPSQFNNRDYLRSIELKNQNRNSGLYKFFHTAVPPGSVQLFGFVLEENSNVFIGLENKDRISEE